MASRATLIPFPTVEPRTRPTRWQDILALGKMRVVSLVVFTSFVGYWLAPAQHSLVQCLGISFLVAMGAAGSAALNQWYEVDIDAEMPRTRNRPLASGRMLAEHALRLGTGLSLLSVILMAAMTNLTAAALLLAAIVTYVGVYTMWLKRSTAFNIVIGGAAGAFPPMIGWAAATGQIGLFPILLFALILLWTPAHFWALSLYMRAEYAAAGVPMMPVVAGVAATRRQILLYAVATAAIALALWLVGFAGDFYGFQQIILSMVLVGAAIRVVTSRRTAPARMRAERQMFGFSIVYLFATFGTLLLDAALHG